MHLEYSEYQDQLVRGLAHRMNNILTLFHGYLGLLMESNRLDPREREGLVRISNGARAATELMDRTHALVRAAGPADREIDPGLLLNLLRPSFEARLGPKTELILDVPERLPVMLADGARLKTAIVELVRNALEATLAGGTVRVSCRQMVAPDATNRTRSEPWISFCVTDSGSGIPARIANAVFEPFVTTKTQHDSAGLGLTLALTFAQQQGGDIRFESQAGGTMFEMRVPCRGRER